VRSHTTDKEGVIMQSPLVVSRGAVDAYEKASGFIGFGRFFEERGLLTIRKEEPCEESA